ncbi:MAG: hypothetical protein CBD18_08460 [Opitutales bacterium TMED158]|nr:MAG: hypothetical protein CBD18_08460 [Opitutales bacterium TMED158]
MSLAFQEVVDAYYQNLYRFALSLCRSSDQAWDLTQETFLVWARKRSSIRSEKATKSWLYTTLYREFLKVARRNARLVALEDQEMDYENLSDSDADLPSFDSGNVMELLMDLKIEYRKAVTLYYLESYSYKEIAEILDIPIGTVMSRLARGKDVLRRKLRGEGAPGKVISYPVSERMSGNG